MFNLSKSTRLVAASGLIISAVLFASVFSGNVAASPLLGTAQSFAVLGGSTVTNTGATTVFGDLGVSPGTAITGFPPGNVSGGAIHSADAVAGQAQADLVVAYNTLAGMACDPSDPDAANNLTGEDLGGLTLLPGVYCFSSSAQLTGMLTLDALGNPDAVFVFQIGSTLTTASDSSVLMIGGSVCNVFWQVGSSATLGTNTDFVGNIVALTSITLNTGATIAGRALARNGAVTMDTNNVSAAGCITVPELPTETPELTATTVPPTSTATTDARTPTVSVPTATPEATSGPGTPTLEATSIPGTPTSEETSVPGTPTSEATTAPGPPAPGTSTPANPTATIPGIVPIPGVPAPVTPTPESTLPATATVEIQNTPLPATSTPVAPIVQTLVPATATSASTVQETATVEIQITPLAVTGTPQAETSTPVALTIVPLATAVTPVTFPQTGSAGLLVTQNDQLMSTTQLMIGIAIVMLLTGSLGFVIERRDRR